MGGGDLHLIAVADVLAGVSVGALGPRHPHRAVRADGHRRAVVEITGAALVADEPGRPEPPAAETVAIATDPFVMQLSPGGAAPATTSRGPFGAAAAAGS